MLRGLITEHLIWSTLKLSILALNRFVSWSLDDVWWSALSILTSSTTACSASWRSPSRIGTT